MISVFLESLQTGQIMAMILLGVLAGYFVGKSRLGVVGVIIWFILILAVQFVLLFTSSLAKAYLHAHTHTHTHAHLTAHITCISESH